MTVIYNNLIGKKVLVNSKAFNIQAKGIVIEEGCFKDHYTVDMGQIHFEVCGLIENKLLCHKDELTVI